MIKSYYLTYGSFFISKEALMNLLHNTYNLSFAQGDSSYYGDYFFYGRSSYGDCIRIVDNYIEGIDYYFHEENKAYKTIILCQFVEGKNKDKLSQYEFIKEAFKHIEPLDLLSDEVLEEA